MTNVAAQKVVVPHADAFVDIVSSMIDPECTSLNEQGETVYVAQITQADAILLGNAAREISSACPACVETSAEDKENNRSAAILSLPTEKTNKQISFNQYDLVIAQNKGEPGILTINITTRQISKTLH